MDESNGNAEDDDKDGWDDMDAFESPTPPPALSRIQAAQQQPVQAPKLYQGNSIPSMAFILCSFITFLCHSSFPM